jgi:hypothetical protein
MYIFDVAEYEKRWRKLRPGLSILVSGFSQIEMPGESAKKATCLGWEQASLGTLTSLACEEGNLQLWVPRWWLLCQVHRTI